MACQPPPCPVSHPLGLTSDSRCTAASLTSCGQFVLQGYIQHISLIFCPEAFQYPGEGVANGSPLGMTTCTAQKWRWGWGGLQPMDKRFSLLSSSGQFWETAFSLLSRFQWHQVPITQSIAQLGSTFLYWLFLQSLMPVSPGHPPNKLFAWKALS